MALQVNHSEHVLQTRLESLGRRVRRIGGASACAWSVLAACSLWLALVWLDLLWELSAELRIGVTVAALTAGIVVGIALLWRGRRATRGAALARRLDQTAAAQGQIVAGFDLSQQRQFADELSHGLAILTVQRAGALADVVVPAQAASLRPLRVPFAGALGVAALIGAIVVALPRLAGTEWLRFIDPFGDHPPYSRVQFQVEPAGARIPYGSGLDVWAQTEGAPVNRLELVLQTGDGTAEESLPMFPEPSGKWRTVLTGVTQSGHYFVRAGRSRSQHFRLDVVTTPKLSEVRCRVQMPEYTRRPPYEGPLPAAGLSGLPGTRVELIARSNRPLASGQLQLVLGNATSAVTMQPTSAGADEVAGSFTITAAGKFVIGVTDVDGTPSTETMAGVITLMHDDTPFVRILRPPAVSLATPEATLPVQISGEDDFGIARLQLFRSLNDSRATPLDLEIPHPPATRYDTDVALPLSAYGLAPGDVIKLFARIEDNDPDGAKSSESSISVVQIISQAQYEKMLRMQQGMDMLMSKYREADRRMQALADEVAALQKKLQESAGKELDDADRQQLKQFAQRLRRESHEVRESMKQLLPFDIDKNMLKELAAVAGDLDAAADELDEPDPPDLTPEQARERLRAMLRKLKKRQEQFAAMASLPLSLLQAVYPLIESQARFSQLYYQQRDLADRLASLKGRGADDDPSIKSRMRSLETEQQRLRLALGELLSDIEGQAQKLPADQSDEELQTMIDDLRASALKFVDEVRASDADTAMSEAEAALASFDGTAAHAAAEKAADILEKFLKESEDQSSAGQGCLAFQPQLKSSLGNTIAQLLAEAGLSSGGKGSGSGFSAQRNSLNNIGLYGTLPGVEKMNGRSRDSANASGRASPGGKINNRHVAGAADESPAATAAGSAAVTVPARYRGRVGAYFRRIAEESAEQPDR